MNTGGVDPVGEIAEVAHEAGAWLHVDGAFGLWAAASPSSRPLLDGVELADSWATDAHKWLNVPYDCGLAFVADPQAHRAAMAMTAEYLVAEDGAARDAMDWTPEFSRRARGISRVRGVAVARTCRVSRTSWSAVARMRGGSRTSSSQLPGCEVLNEVVLNQVLLRFGDDETTAGVLRRVQESGEAWMSGTTWDGRAAIRISVSNWRTSESDVARTVAAFRHALSVG